MSGKRFIELINLYLDKEISEAEMEELKRETTNNPERGRVFADYVLLEQASTQLNDRHGERLVESVDFKKYQMIARNSGWSLRRAVWVSTGAFAAACLLLIAAVRSLDETVVGGPSVALSPSAHDQWIASVEVFQPTEAQALRGFTVSERTRPSLRSDKPELPTRQVNWTEAANGRSAPAGFSVQLAVEDWKPAKSQRVFRSTPVFQASPEMASFEFQR